MEFSPPWPLRSAHAQTVLASRLTRAAHLTTPEFEAAAKAETITCRDPKSGDKVRLQALVNISYPQAPLVVLLHGWLGDNRSAYVCRTAALLHRQGYNIARLNFRDHGDTAHLNEALFHAARLAEVLDACNHLVETYAPAPPTNNGHVGSNGIVGFSLGGNFALRLAGQPNLNTAIGHCVAICPAVNPTSAAWAIDNGWFGYQYYFVQRWQKALTAKAAAFPDIYDFEEAKNLRTVDALTEYFVAQHTDFSSVRSYYNGYQVTPATLQGANPKVSILAAADDPVIPVHDIRELAVAANAHYAETLHGGHCGFITDIGGSSPVPGWVAQQLAGASS